MSFPRRVTSFDAKQNSGIDLHSNDLFNSALKSLRDTAVESNGQRLFAPTEKVPIFMLTLM